MRRLIEYIFGPTIVMEEPGRDPTFDPEAYKANRTKYGVILMLVLMGCGLCFWIAYAGAAAYASTLPTRTPSITPTGQNTATPTLTMTPAESPTPTYTPNVVGGFSAPHVIPSDAPDKPTRTYTPVMVIVTQIVRVNVGGGGGVREVEVTRLVPATVLATVVQTRWATVEVTRIITQAPITGTATHTPTPSSTATATLTFTPSATPTVTQTQTPWPTPTPYPTYTPPPTQTPWIVTATFTPTPTPTETATPTPTETETATATAGP